MTLSWASVDDREVIETTSYMASLGNLTGFNLSIKSYQYMCRMMALAEVSVNPTIQPWLVHEILDLC
jgi:hypothetical protein